MNVVPQLTCSFLLSTWGPSPQDRAVYIQGGPFYFSQSSSEMLSQTCSAVRFHDDSKPYTLTRKTDHRTQGHGLRVWSVLEKRRAACPSHSMLLISIGLREENGFHLQHPVSVPKKATARPLKIQVPMPRSGQF